MEDKIYKDIPIVQGVFRAADLPGVPPQIHKMRQMYQYGDNSNEMKSKNFYRQGKFMENFNDNATTSIYFQHYYPTYHDMNISQLRTYFTWRTDIRNNGFKPNALSYVYLYIYELINGIGTKSPQDALNKLSEICAVYSGDGYDARKLNNYINKWIIDFCIVNNLSKDLLSKYLSSKPNDYWLSILKAADNYSDNEIISALEQMSGKKILKSLLFTRKGDTAIHYFAAVWRYLSNTLFDTIFYNKITCKWQPFENAIYYVGANTKDFIYQLFATVQYYFRKGVWYIEYYEVAYTQKLMLQNFLGALDFKLREFFNIKCKIKEAEAYRVFYDNINKAIKYCENQLRPQIQLNINSLEQIRSDSNETCQSLLTEEDLDTTQPANIIVNDTKQFDSNTTPNQDSIENQILILLLQNKPISQIIKNNHIMPSVLTDKINEIYYEQFADNVVDFDGLNICLIDDYIEDLKNLLLH